MNEKFFELPEEKRMKIMNAGFEVFGKNDYKRASTDQIAAKADISKGLLFYYFHNKKALYMFLFEFATNMLKDYVIDCHFSEIKDVFELFEYAALKKYQLLIKSPHIMDFVIRAFYSQKEDVSEDLNEKLSNMRNELYDTYLSKMDFSKFRGDVDPQEILKLLNWAADGYLHERQRFGLSIDLDDLMDKYRVWTTYFKRISYKEEYLK